MTLSELIQQAKDAGKTNVADIARYLNRRPVEVVETVTSRPATQAEIDREQPAINAMAQFIKLLDPDGNIGVTIGRAKAGTVPQFVAWVRPRYSALSDPEKDQAKLLISEIQLHYANLQASGTDWRRDDFGGASKSQTLTSKVYGESLAETHLGGPVRYSQIKDALKA